MKTLLALSFFLPTLVWSVAAIAEETDSSLRMHRPVFLAIEAEDPEAFLSMCHPELRKKIDSPVLLTWMRAMNESLGRCQYRLTAQHGYRVEYTLASKQVTSDVAMKFELGSAESELTFLDDKIIQFHIRSDQLADDWFDGPANGKLYFERSEKFLRGLIDRQFTMVEPMMHANLAELAPRDTLIQIQTIAEQWLGDLQSIEPVGAEWVAGESPLLHVRFRMRGDNGDVWASTKFFFDGLQGHLIAFNYSPIVQADAASSAGDAGPAEGEETRPDSDRPARPDVPEEKPALAAS